jgi:hypothetical protein
MKPIIIPTLVGLAIVTRIIAPAAANDPRIKQLDQENRGEQT